MAKTQTNYWISAGKFALLERMSVLIFGIGTFVLLVRTLSTESYGAWMLFISLATLLETARNGFFKNPLIRFSNISPPEDVKQLEGSSLLMNLLFSVALAIVLALIASPLANAWQSPSLIPLIYIFIPTSFILAFFFHFDYVQRANAQFYGPFLAYFFKNGSLFIAVAIHFIWRIDLDIILLAYYYGGSALFGTIVSYLTARKVYQFSLSAKKAVWLQLFSYGKYTLGTNLSAVLLRNIDIWMIGWYINPASVAIYNVAIRVANLFEVPSMALASVLFPEAVKRAEKEGTNAIKQLYEKSVAVILIFSVPFVVGVLLFSEEIVVLIAGEAYIESAIILNITMLYGLLVPFNKQMGVVLDAVGKAKTNMIFVLRNAIINVILNSIFIPIWGITGAAFATLSTMLIVLFINQIYLKKNFQIELKGLFINYVGYHKKLILLLKSRL
ncbi:MAG: lipopolysaccharide exporter [Sediminicola sp.]|jgi:lipopolysaccharide exporter